MAAMMSAASQRIKSIGLLLLSSTFLFGCAAPDIGSDAAAGVSLSRGVDASAGGDPAFIITTPAATYYLEKQGGGLSSMVDPDGVDWLGFHKEKGSGHMGEYRGFPNAVHKQDGNFFHAMNAGTDPSTSTVEIERADHIRITVTSGNGAWVGHYDFYPDRLDFTMARVSPSRKYWIQYEGVPGGEMDKTDFWISSAEDARQTIETPFTGDLPSPEWMAFGDVNSPRVLYMLHHGDDTHPDDYSPREHMTVFAFGRRGKDKYLTTPDRFSIGFIEATDYASIESTIAQIVD